MQERAEQQPDGMEPIRQAIRRWAAWLREESIGCRGYPKSVAFIHADEQRETAHHEVIEDEEVHRVERAMIALRAWNRRAFLAVFYDYYLELTNKEAAERLKTGETKYKQLRAMGESYVAGKIA